MKMESILEEYANRVEEIQLIIDLLENQSNQDGKVAYFFKDVDVFDLYREDTVKHILFSTVLVMIYNLAESTALAAVEYIYDHLADEKVSYDHLNDNFKRRVVGDFKKKQFKLVEFVQKKPSRLIGQSIIETSLDKKYFFSGNVDRHKITSTFDDLSFSFETESGKKLERVKDARRKLTHSENSFARYGRDISFEELNFIVKDVKTYFDVFLENLDCYIKNEGYRVNSA